MEVSTWRFLDAASAITVLALFIKGFVRFITGTDGGRPWQCHFGFLGFVALSLDVLLVASFLAMLGWMAASPSDRYESRAGSAIELESRVRVGTALAMPASEVLRRLARNGKEAAADARATAVQALVDGDGKRFAIFTEKSGDTAVVEMDTELPLGGGACTSWLGIVGKRRWLTANPSAVLILISCTAAYHPSHLANNRSYNFAFFGVALAALAGTKFLLSRWPRGDGRRKLTESEILAKVLD